MLVGEENGLRSWWDQPKAGMVDGFCLEGWLRLAAIGCPERWAETINIVARLRAKRLM